MGRAKKVCAEAGCPELTNGTRCQEHTRDRDKARGTRQERGYDKAFERAKRNPTYVDATHCTNCGQPFTEANPKTAGHTTAIRTGGTGSTIEPHCRRCNYGWRKTGL